MAAHTVICVLVLLCQIWVVKSSEYCDRNGDYFYCCGNCEDLDGLGDETCVTSKGNYHYSTYDCTYYTDYYYYNYYDDTISAGAIVGIIMGCLAGLGVIVSITICFCIRRCRMQPSSTSGQVIHSGQMSVITLNNTTTQGFSGYPVQGQNMPVYANQQGTPNYTPTSSPSGMTSQAYASNSNLSQPPPSYEQIFSLNHLKGKLLVEKQSVLTKEIGNFVYYSRL